MMFLVELEHKKATQKDLEPSYREVLIEQGRITEKPVPTQDELMKSLEALFGGG